MMKKCFNVFIELSSLNCLIEHCSFKVVLSLYMFILVMVDFLYCIALHQYFVFRYVDKICYHYEVMLDSYLNEY